MAFPTVVCRLGFGYGALAGTVTWTDVSTDLLEYSSRRGRQRDLDRIEPGVANVTLDNRHGNYWPDNGASSYYPNVKLGVQLNIRAIYAGGTYDRFRGVVERWHPAYRSFGGTQGAVMELTVSEATKIMALADLSGQVYVQQNSGTRVSSVADTAGWPSNLRDIATGQSTILASGTVNDQTAGPHLDNVSLSELGLLFQKPDMTLVFQDRHARLKSPYLTSLGTIGISASEWHYREPELRFDDERLYNDVRIQRLGGTTKTASDATSQSSYGKRSLIRTSLIMSTEGEAQDQADYLLSRYSEPAMEIESVTIKPGENPDVLFPILFAREISDRVTISLPSGSISEDKHIEAIGEDVHGKDWAVHWRLSDADAQEYWAIGVSTLGVNTRLAYAIAALWLSAHLVWRAMLMFSMGQA